MSPDRIDQIVAKVREKWSYIDIDNFHADLDPVPDDWRTLTADFVEAIEATEPPSDGPPRIEQATAAPGELR